MPHTSAQVKIAAVQAYGGRADLIDVHKIGRTEGGKQLLAEHPGSFPAPAYDDYRVGAGNLTLGMEILTYADFYMIVVPVGGGGLIFGIGIARVHHHTHT